MDIIRHNILFVLFFLVGTPASVQSETIEPLPYGDMDFWTTRIITKATGTKTTHYPGTDKAEVFILLQYRWEDSKGNLYAKRVGTARERYVHNTNGWVNRHRIKVMYGDITHKEGYKPYMGLIPSEKSYYARNSKGKMVPVHEVGWADASATPTHLLVMASSGCGTAYTGTVGMQFSIDNIALVF